MITLLFLLLFPAYQYTTGVLASIALLTVQEQTPFSGLTNKDYIAADYQPSQQILYSYPYLFSSKSIS